MLFQIQLKKLNTQYWQLREDAKKLMLRGELKSYLKKLIQITVIESAYREAASRSLKAA